MKELKDEGLRCPQCDYDRISASDAWCWRCGVWLPVDWVAQQS